MTSNAFATLKPTNLAARVAFSKAVELSRSQPQPAWSICMSIDPTPVYDEDYARSCERNQVIYDADSEASATEPDSDTEARWHTSYKLWTGSFIFTLSDRDPGIDVIWRIGKGRPNHATPDGGVHFKLDSTEVRGWHASFILGESGFVVLVPLSRAAHNVTVGGKLVAAGDGYHLNKRTFHIGIGLLSFDFSYTDYAHSEEFEKLRTQFWTQSKDRRLLHASEAALSLTPMPSKDNFSVGRWVMSKALGKGASGKVYSATDSSGAVVAIKIVERNGRTSRSVAKEVRSLQELTRQAKDARCDNIICLVEVIGDYQSDTGGLLFKDIYFVFDIAVYQTIDQVVHSDTSSRTCLQYFRGILQGLKFLHDRHWIHRDVKDQNVGIYQGRAILLDLGHAIHLAPPLTSISATPGHFGTVGYHAPEAELAGSSYDCGIDIWSAGIVGYALFYHLYPFSFSRNPWRKGNEQLLSMFLSAYRLAHHRLLAENDDAPGVNDLLLQMLRFEGAPCNRGPRITAGGALAHREAWRYLDDEDGSLVKRVR